jgi:hypothetical protein
MPNLTKRTTYQVSNAATWALNNTRPSIDSHRECASLIWPTWRASAGLVWPHPRPTVSLYFRLVCQGESGVEGVKGEIESGAV